MRIAAEWMPREEALDTFDINYGYSEAPFDDMLSPPNKDEFSHSEKNFYVDDKGELNNLNDDTKADEKPTSDKPLTKTDQNFWFIYTAISVIAIGVLTLLNKTKKMYNVRKRF